MSTTHQRPFSIKLFLPTGDPDGLRVVEKSNWTGIGVYFKRTNFTQVTQRPEFNKTGVYILVGNPTGSSLPTLYVGEGDPVGPRLSSHQREKDFWEWAIFFTTKDHSLNKAHIKHLESRLLDLATTAKQCQLDNCQSSLPPTLSESDIADAESFLSDILNILPLLGLTALEPIESSSQPTTTLSISSKNLSARGYEDPKGFIVLQGSQAIYEELPSMHQYMSTLRQDLIQQGILESSSGSNSNVVSIPHYCFTQDYAFSSPSTAAGVILGRPSNGRIEWKDFQGRSLKEIQSVDTSA